MSKQIVAAFALFLGSNAITAAQAATAQERCALPAIAASAALQDIPATNLMTVPVQINGKPKQFLLDIGANPTEISQAAVKELSLSQPARHADIYDSGGRSQSWGNDGGTAVGASSMQLSVVDARSGRASEDSRRLVGVESFTIGQATGRNLVFAVASDGKIGTSEPYDGLMTGSFFGKYDVELDFAGKKINYLTPTGCDDLQQVVFWPHAQVAAIPMSMSDGKIGVQVTIQGHVINAVMDTSSPHTIMRRDIAERIFSLQTDTPEVMPAEDMRDGLGVRIYRHTFPQISFAGGVTALNVPALIQTNSMTYNLNREPRLGSRAQFKQEAPIPDLTLGMDVLRQLHLYVAQGQNNIYVTSAK